MENEEPDLTKITDLELTQRQFANSVERRALEQIDKTLTWFIKDGPERALEEVRKGAADLAIERDEIKAESNPRHPEDPIP